MMKIQKFKVLLYQKKGSTDKRGKAPIMGRISLNRSDLFACQSKNSMAQFSCKSTNLWRAIPCGDIRQESA
jgi:hypothetical protein